MRALLQENLAYEKLARWNLNQSLLKGKSLIRSQFCLLGSLGGSPNVGHAVFSPQELVDSCDLCTRHTVNERDAPWESSLIVLLNRPKAFLHGSVDLFGSRWVNAIEEVLQTALVLVIR